MDRAEFTNSYWKYYLHLENEFISTIDFVMLDENNFKTLSTEYQKLLLATGSEYEIILKELCRLDSSNNKSITDLKAVIKFSELTCSDNGVRVMNSLTLTSSKLFGGGWLGDTPDWWKIYNRVKHGRSSNYKEASLGNMLYVLVSLYLSKEYLHKKVILGGEVDFISPELNLSTLSWERRHSSMQKATLEKVDSNYVAPLIDFKEQEGI